MSDKVRDGQKALHAVRKKIQNKFFNNSKIQVSMFESDKDKDIKAKDNLKVGEEYKDRNGTIWIRNEEGSLEQKHSFLGKFRMPLFCPTKGCGKIMKGRADEKMWIYHNKCHHCVIDEESKMRADGTFEEYERKKLEANKKAWIADMENLLKDWNKDQAQEQVQFIMNSSGEMETWDTKDKENKDKTRLEQVVQEVKNKLEENSDEM